MKTAKLEEFNKRKKPWEVEGVEWREVRLGDISLPIEKVNPKNKNPEEIFSYLDISNIDNGNYKVKGWNKIKWKNAPSRARKIIKAGDIVFATTRPYLKNIAIVPEDLNNQICSTGFCVHRPNPKITISEFIFYNVIRNKFISLISSKMRGTSYPAVLDSDIYFSKIPLPFRNGKPDLETQKKIVEYIETNFEKIDKILEKKKKELEQINELWESVLEQAFKPKDGEEWREVKLEEITYIESGNRPKGGVKKYTEGIPSIGGEHLNYDGSISFDKIKYVPVEFYNQVNKGKIQKNDILIVKDGATTGKTAFIDESFPFKEAMVNEHVFICRIKDIKSYYPKFIFRFLMSKEGQYRILKTKGGTAQGGINKRFSKLVKNPLPFHNNQPDLEKQKEIAEYLDNVYEKIKTLKEKIQNQISQLEELKESILDEVFRHDETG